MNSNLIKKCSYLSLIILFSTILVLVAPKSHEVGPNVEPEYIYLNKFMNFQVNVDSDHMLNLSSNLKNIFNENESRQIRPLLIITANVLSKPINVILKTFNLNKKLNLNFDGNYKNIKNEKKIPIYLSYVAINYLILFISCFLVVNLMLNYGNSLTTALILITLLTINHNTKYFLLTPHFQMFNILCPILGIYLLNFFKDYENFSENKFYLICFLLGFLLLFYSIFINLLFFIIFSLIVNHKKNLSLVKKIILTFFFFLLSSLLYLIFLKIYTNSIYIHETKAANMFVWILDLNLNNFFYIVFGNIKNFLLTFNVQFFLIIFILYLFFKKKIGYNLKINKFTNELIVFFILLFFLYLMGFYRESLTINLTFPLLIMLSGMMTRNQNNITQYIFIPILIISNLYFFLLS